MAVEKDNFLKEKFRVLLVQIGNELHGKKNLQGSEVWLPYQYQQWRREWRWAGYLIRTHEERHVWRLHTRQTAGRSWDNRQKGLVRNSQQIQRQQTLQRWNKEEEEEKSVEEIATPLSFLWRRTDSKAHAEMLVHHLQDFIPVCWSKPPLLSAASKHSLVMNLPGKKSKKPSLKQRKS